MNRRSAIRARWNHQHLIDAPTGTSRLARALSRRWPNRGDGDRMLADAMAVAADDRHPNQRRALAVLLREMGR